MKEIASAIQPRAREEPETRAKVQQVLDDIFKSRCRVELEGARGPAGDQGDHTSWPEQRACEERLGEDAGICSCVL